MEMRLRLPELLTEHKPPLTAYAVAKASGDRISLSTIYRLCRDEGKVANFDGELMEALCDVFGVRPGELLEREAEGTSAKRRARRRKRPASAEK
jgi:DNA-binding Xre family transcriptional regulator